jgi:hypothetical protein
VAKPWSQYQQLIVETYYDVRARESSHVRVRPAADQAFPTTMNVECSRSIRSRYPVGTRFYIYAKETDKEGGNPFLYSHYDWPFEVLD